MRTEPPGYSTALILGAGFSYAAGFPLASQLPDVRIETHSNAQHERIQAVRRHWQKWGRENPDTHLEAYVQEIYDSWFGSDITWPDLVEYISLALATPLTDEKHGFSYRNAQSILEGRSHPAYAPWWALVLSSINLKCIITLNYDILVEMTAPKVIIDDHRSVSFFYAGFSTDSVQAVISGYDQKKVMVKRRVFFNYRGTTPIYKLHGSLNWSLEPDGLKVYADIRPAFRNRGDSLIIPPMPEKSVPSALAGVWRGALRSLTRAKRWLVCGYSLPRYDSRVRELIAMAASRGEPKQLVILDPAADQLAETWQHIVPSAQIATMPGLPDCIPSMVKFDWAATS